MSQPLGEIFGELGISQYLDAFVDQGFDTWETILDITESDLDALGVKLGHRRKLQRRIANFRGVAPDAALVSPTQQSAEERQDVAMTDTPTTKEDLMMIIKHKRKYRRHPKPDENAPERPPSAYVLFSNKMRDDLRDRNLSFTEIAKLVGENWQALHPSEKEPYETQAQQAKDRYNAELFEYKKTSEYRQYLMYLHDFKTKYPPPPSQDKDGPKRVKMLSDTGGSHNGPHHGAGAGGPRRPRSQTTSGSSSVDGRNKDSEPPPTRDRVNSTSSLPELASTAEMPSNSSVDDEHSPPPPTLSSATSPRGDAPYTPTPWASVPEPQQHQPQPQHQLPSLSNVLETHKAETNGFVTTHFQLHNGNSPGSPPSGLVNGHGGHSGSGDSRHPSLRHEYSSGASTTSGSTTMSNGYPRTPIDGSLPIHLLLSGSSDNGNSGSTSKQSMSPEQKPMSQYPPYLHHHQQLQQHSPHSAEPPMLSPITNGVPSSGGSGGGYFPAPPPPPPLSAPPSAAPRTMNGIAASHPGPPPPPPPPPPYAAKMPPHLLFNSTHHHHAHHHHGMPNHPPHHLHHHHPNMAPNTVPGRSLPGLPNLDGMSALLKAGEIVDRDAR